MRQSLKGIKEEGHTNLVDPGWQKFKYDYLRVYDQKLIIKKMPSLSILHKLKCEFYTLFRYITVKVPKLFISAIKFWKFEILTILSRVFKRSDF